MIIRIGLIAVVIGVMVILFSLPARADVQYTDVALITMSAGLEGLLYYEFVETAPIRSSAVTGSFVTSSEIMIRRENLGFLARGNLTPVMLGGGEDWRSNETLIQENDLSYRLTRAVVALGYVLPGGLEPQLGFWYAKGTQIREDFRPPTIVSSSIERIWSRGFILGLQGASYNKETEFLSHFFGNLVLIPGFQPFRAVVTNTAIPGVELHSSGIGLESGGSYGRTFGSGPTKLLTSLKASFILLYYDGQVRSDVAVEWPSNLTVGVSWMLQIGGGWFWLFQ